MSNSHGLSRSEQRRRATWIYLGYMKLGEVPSVRPVLEAIETRTAINECASEGVQHVEGVTLCRV